MKQIQACYKKLLQKPFRLQKSFEFRQNPFKEKKKCHDLYIDEQRVETVDQTDNERLIEEVSEERYL